MKANFTATTDSHVGEAIKFFHSRNSSVEVRYKVTTERKHKEAALERKIIEANIPLLKLAYYNHNETLEDEERRKVHEFCTAFLDAIEKL